MEGHKQAIPEAPLVRLIHQLAEMQQNTATLQKQQSEALLAIDGRLQQAEAQRQLPAEPPDQGAAAALRNHQRLLQDSLHKMTVEDDAEAFLEVFDSVAAECGWTEDLKAWRLLPLLTGEAQLAAHSLPAVAQMVYPHRSLTRGTSPPVPGALLR